MFQFKLFSVLIKKLIKINSSSFQVCQKKKFTVGRVSLRDNGWKVVSEGKGDTASAKCKACRTVFKLPTMGKSILKDHSRGSK